MRRAAALALAIAVALIASPSPAISPAMQRIVLSGAPVDSSAKACLAAQGVGLGTPFAVAENTAIRQLKQQGIWQVGDIVSFFGAPTSAAGLVNCLNVAKSWGSAGSPVFTAFHGLAGNGSTAVLTWPDNVGLLTNFKQNAATFSIFVNNNVSAAVKDAGYSGNNGIQITSLASASTAAIRFNGGAANNVTLPANTSVGSLTIVRSGSTGFETYKDGADLGATTQASTALPSSAFTLLSAAGTSFSTREIGFVFIGGIITAAQAAALSAIEYQFLRSVGDPV